MSVGTKVILAIIGLLVIVLVTYYGYMLPTPGTSNGAVSFDSNASIEDPTGNPLSGTDRDEFGSLMQGGGAPSGESPEQFVSRPQGLLSSGLRNAENQANQEQATSPSPTLESEKDSTPPAPPPTESPSSSQENDAKPNTPAAIPVEYTIREGDTLMTISANWFGDPYAWERIVWANPGLDPKRLRVGQRILLPPSDAPLSLGSLPGRESRIHEVRRGDTLSGLAETYYGNGKLWERIFEANRLKLNGDPDALQLGMELTIPAAPE